MGLGTTGNKYVHEGVMCGETWDIFAWDFLILSPFIT